MTTTIERPPTKAPSQPSRDLSLRFNAYAWAKFNYLLNVSENEVFCFGITPPNDPTLVTDLWIPKQTVSLASAELDEDDLSQRIEEMAQHAPISSFLRVWLHTHPGNCAKPSGTDLETQKEIFGTCDWSVMAILAKGGDFHNEVMWCGPDKRSHIRVKIPHYVDWSLPFKGTDPDAWQAEYDANVNADRRSTYASSTTRSWPESNAKMGGKLTSEEQQELMYLSEMWNDNDPQLTDEMVTRLEELETKSDGNDFDELDYLQRGWDHNDSRWWNAT
ncbi:MAG: hypothetical protein ACO395_07405 [Pontimonas sp.]